MRSTVSRKCTPKVSVISLIIGLALLTVALILAFVVFPNVIRNQIIQFVRLEEGTEQWDRFVEVPFPLDFKIYIFNVENPTEVLAGAKPRVRQVGPYVYNETRLKRDIYIDTEDDTVSYYQDQYFSFNKDASGNLSDTDKITMLNPVLMGVLQTTEQIEGEIDLDVEAALPSMFYGASGLFIEVEVKQVLFEGVRICDPDRTTIVAKLLCLTVTLMNLKNMDYQEDGSILFSLFGYKNNSDDGYYTVSAGNDDVYSLGRILKWNNQSFTPYWGGIENECNSVFGGYDSTIYPPFSDDLSSYPIYSTDIYRSVPIFYQEETWYQDLPGKRYGANEDVFTESEPERSCYCINKTRDMHGNPSCFLDGTVDIFEVLNVPAFLSLPHFLYADEKYVNSVDGVRPNYDEHYTYVDLEAGTGTPLFGTKKIQINMFLRPVTFGDLTYDMTNHLVPAAMPIVWIDEGVALPEEYVDLLNTQYFNTIKIVDGVKWGLIALSGVVSVAFIVFLFYSFNRTKAFKV